MAFEEMLEVAVESVLGGIAGAVALIKRGRGEVLRVGHGLGLGRVNGLPI